jgi:ABC-type lipoprotein release transport system permease subunit
MGKDAGSVRPPRNAIGAGMYLRILWKQMRQRWGVSLLLLAAMTTLVALYVYLNNTAGFANRSMQIIVKRMGHNLLLIPRSANPMDVHLCTDRQPRFEAATTDRLAEHLELASKYYVSVLQEQVDANPGRVVLTGILPVARADETAEKGNMLRPIPPGHARLGAHAAEQLGAKTGERVELLGRTFTVSRVEQEIGDLRDARVYVPLDEAQAMLDADGRINAIWAFECMRGRSLSGIEAYQRARLEKVAPELRQLTRMDIATGRWLARRTTSRYLRYFLVLLGVVTVALIAISGMQEVAERRREVGVMLSMGAGYGQIVAMLAGKILLLAGLAGVVGFVAGAGLSVWTSRSVLVANTSPPRIVWEDLPGVVALACCVAVASELLAMVRLARLDPCAALVRE